MRYGTIILVLVLTPCFVLGQKQSSTEEYLVNSLKPVPFGLQNNAGLVAIRKAIGNKRIVLLGEQSHFNGNVLKIKQRIVEYLHDSLGFDVLIKELPYYPESLLMNTNTLESFQYTYAIMNTSYMLNEVEREKLAYIWRTWREGDSLHLAGMDVGGPVTYKYIAKNADRIANETDPKLASTEDWKSFIKKLQFRYHNKKELDFLISFKNKFCNDKRHSNPKYERIKQGINHAVMTIQYRDFIEKHKGMLEVEDFADRAVLRDQFMATTVKYFIEHLFPGKKIIISASNYHTARNLEDLKSLNEHFNNGVPMGHLLHKIYEDDIYSLAISSREGNFGLIFPKNEADWFKRYNFSRPKHSVLKKNYLAIRAWNLKSSKRDFEWSIVRAGYQAAFVDFFGLRKSNTTILPFHMSPTFTLQKSFKYDWINVYDGVIITDKASYVKVRHIHELFPSEEDYINISRLSNYLFSNPRIR